MPSVFRAIANAFRSQVKPLVRVRAPRDRRRWPDWISSGLTLERMSSVLRDADQGNMQDLMALLQEIASKEPLLNGLLSVRLSALSQRPVVVRPSKQDKDRDRAVIVADYVQDVIDNLKIAKADKDEVIFSDGLKTVIENILLSVYYGVQVGWIHYGTAKDTEFTSPLAIEFLDERRFYLDIATDRLHIATESQGLQGSAIKDYPAMQTVEIRNTRLSKRLPMAGFGRSILMSWWLRFQTQKDLTNYAETWGRPGLVINSKEGETGGYNEDQFQELKNYLEDYMADTRILMPPGFSASLLEAKSGGEKIFELIDDMTERHMQFAAVGQVGSIAGDATTFAAGKQAQRVRDDLTDGDARLVAEVLEKIGRYAIALRFGPDVPAPYIEFETEKSLEAIQQRATAIRAAAYPLGSMLQSGIPVDIVKYCSDMNIPLRPDGQLDPLYFANLKALASLGISGAVPTDEAPSDG